MLYLLRLLCLLLISCSVVSQQRCLLIFQDANQEQLTDSDGMNIAHQLLTALVQKAAPILVAHNVWNHILMRQERYKISAQNTKTASSEVERILEDIDKRLRSGASLVDLNSSMNMVWYQKNFPLLAQLDTDSYKAVCFDSFCARLSDLLVDWTIYQAPQQYLLLIPNKTDLQGFNNKKISERLHAQALKPIKYGSATDLVACLSMLLRRNDCWSIYLTGHGYHVDQDHQTEMIAGMEIKDFQNLLLFLQQKIKTNLLVYSSCFSSGVHLVKPYFLHGKDMILNYPVIATCLTDAPVYVLGYPAGFKLPPYDATFGLEPSDIGQTGLQWYLMQNFNDFCRNSITKNKNFKHIAQSVTVYQECYKQRCDVAKLENMPLIRPAKESFFVPIDTTFINCIIHDLSKKIICNNKFGLLWYTKRYSGSIALVNKIPQFVCMLPYDSVVWMHAIQALSFDLQQLLKSAFLSIEDMHKVQIFLCDRIVCKDKILQQVMIIPQSHWVPQAVASGVLGVCIYKIDDCYYSIPLDICSDDLVTTTVNQDVYKLLDILWKLLYQDSQYIIKTESVLSGIATHDNTDFHQKLLAECKKQNVCV